MKKFFLVVLFLGFLGCSSQSENSLVHDLNNVPKEWKIEKQANQELSQYFQVNRSIQNQLSQKDWEKLRWLSKAMVLLRGGEGLSPSEDIQPYLKKPRSQIVDELMNDKRFVNTIVKFNLYFLGLKVDSFDGPLSLGSFSSDLLAVTPAFKSAYDFTKGGDYLSLLGSQEYYPIGQINTPRVFSSDGETFEGEEALDHLIERDANRTKELRTIIAKGSSGVDMAEFCSKRSFLTVLFDAGLPISFSNLFHLEGALFDGCSFVETNMPVPPLPQKELNDRLDVYEIQMEKIFKYIRTRLYIKVGFDIQNIDFIRFKDFFPGAELNYFNGFAFSLTNSSTNMNRKRAAYVLDRFLCDNLTPIDIEVPEEHAGDVHGTEPACYACHYRLDPMAGYFKDYGSQFFNFSKFENIIFDDMASRKRAEYNKNWLNPPGSTRKWNIGIIRSEKDENLNHYGETLDDLLLSLKKMPEVRSCLVKRAFEFSVAPEQNVDPGYLKELTDEFNQLALTNSSDAIKKVFKKLVLSNSFVQKDPETDQCYDFGKNYDPKTSAPCEVQHLFVKNCKECHMPFAGENGLDLTTWIQLPSGKFGFPHEPGGKQLPHKESFERILESLTSTDPKIRMPKKKHMDPSDREVLYKWVTKQLEVNP